MGAGIIDAGCLNQILNHLWHLEKLPYAWFRNDFVPDTETLFAFRQEQILQVPGSFSHVGPCGAKPDPPAYESSYAIKALHNVQ